MSATLHLVAGPPFGVDLFRGVVARLRDTRPDLVVQTHSVVELGASPEAAAAALAGRVAAEDLVVAHALAVPAAAFLAHLGTGARVMLLNGPLRALDPVSRAVVALAGLPAAADTVFLPAPWLAWLRSSAGLRRAVANPYAMDRDTVAALCGPLVADRSRRRALVAYLRALATPWPDPGAAPGELTLFWGDNDRLNPLSIAADVEARRGAGTLRVAPGGRYAWPEEMPWSLADTLSARLPAAPRESQSGANPPITTSTSRLGGQAPSQTPLASKKTKGSGGEKPSRPRSGTPLA